MKKLVVVLVILAVFLISGYFYGFKNLFIPSVIQRVKVSNIEELRHKAETAEEDFKKDITSATQAGRAGYAYEKLGAGYLQNGDWTPAIHSFEKAVEYGRSGARVHYNLGIAYANRARSLDSAADIKSAEAHYRRALEIRPGMADAAYGLAILTYYLKKDPAGGIAMARSIAATDPKYYQARFALGRFYYEKGDPASALGVYENLYEDLNREPDSPRIKELRKNCQDNITRLMVELSGSKR
jgi:tetratricopeptide (TPR) repeat protein